MKHANALCQNPVPVQTLLSVKAQKCGDLEVDSIKNTILYTNLERLEQKKNQNPSFVLNVKICPYLLRVE